MGAVQLLIVGYPGFDHILRVSRAPEVGETAIILDPPGVPRATAGGCANNIAVAAARLGIGAAPVIVLGDDTDGCAMRAVLESEGVDTTCVHHVPGGKTAATYLFIEPGGGHQTFYFPGSASANIDLDIPSAILTDLSYGVITVGNPFHIHQLVECLEMAEVPLVWSLRNDPDAFPRDLVERLACACRVLVMNEFESQALMRLLGLETLEALFDYGVEMIVVTQGAQGSRVYRRKKVTTIPAVKPAAVIDPTGAGDAFVGGLLAGLCRGAPVEIAARMGACASSFVIEQWGCQTNLPRWEQMSARYYAEFGQKLL